MDVCLIRAAEISDTQLRITIQLDPAPEDGADAVPPRT